MSVAELFLLGWAVSATIFAIAYHHLSKRLRVALFVMQLGVRLIAESKAKVVIDGDNVKIVEA